MSHLEFTYADLTISTANWPVASVLACLRKGITHVLGNEVASAVTARKKAYAAEHDGQEPSADEVAIWTSELRAEKLEALATGVATPRSYGPRLDPVASEMKKLAREKVHATLKANGIAIPKVGGDAAEITAGETTISISTLIERQLAKNGDELRKRAEKIVRDREKELRFATKAEGTVTGLDDLGL